MHFGLLIDSYWMISSNKIKIKLINIFVLCPNVLLGLGFSDEGTCLRLKQQLVLFCTDTLSFMVASHE